MSDAHDRAGVGNIPLRQRPQVQSQDCRPECGVFAMNDWGLVPHQNHSTARGDATSQRIAFELKSQLLAADHAREAA